MPKGGMRSALTPTNEAVNPICNDGVARKRSAFSFSTDTEATTMRAYPTRQSGEARWAERPLRFWARAARDGSKANERRTGKPTAHGPDGPADVQKEKRREMSHFRRHWLRPIARLVL